MNCSQATLEGVTGVGSASIVPTGPAGNQKLSILNTNIDFDIRSANVRMENLVRTFFYLRWPVDNCATPTRTGIKIGIKIEQYGSEFWI